MVSVLGKVTCSFEIACGGSDLLKLTIKQQCGFFVVVIAKEEWIYGIQQQTQDNIRELIDGMAFG